MTKPMKLSLVAAAVFALVGAAAAVESTRNASPVQFALTGITADQTARLSVSAVTDRTYPPGPCRVTLTFVDEHGQAFVNGDGHVVESHVTLQPGESTFLDLSLTGRLDATRHNLRPVVFDDSGIGGRSGPCLPQLEIIDNATQSTLVTNPGVLVSGWQNHNETLVRDTGE